MKASPPQIFKEAESLKSALSGDSLSSSEAWMKRQELCQLLEALLLTDLDYALDKKVEQDLWSYVFRNPISAFQTKAKEQKNLNHGQSQCQLTNLLETASGFYLMLLQKLCCAYDIDLPCHPRDSSFGLIREWVTKYPAIHQPRKSSLLYICQYCLVHLGDIARYRGQSLQAETFYRHAVDLVPSNGQPYNQLALLEAASGEKLSTVFFYMRSLAVPHPFPVAATNLQNLFAKMIADGSSPEGKSRMSAFEYITGFLQFHAAIHLASDLKKAERMLCQLTASLPALIIAEKLETWQLVQMVAICMFAVEHSWGILEWDSGAREKGKDKSEVEALSEEEQKSASLILELIASMMHAFLLPVHASLEPKETARYYSVPGVKLILDWLLQDRKLLQQEAFSRRPQIWHGLCKLLNDLEIAVPQSFDYKKYEDEPLPEDWDLQCFLPMKKVQRNLKFTLQTESPPEEEANWIRAVRLCNVGTCLSEDSEGGMTLLLAVSQNEGHRHFKAVQQSESLSEQMLQQIQELTVSGSNTTGQNQGQEIEGTTSNGNQGSSTDHPPSLRSLKPPHSEGTTQQEVRFKLDESQQRKEHQQKGELERENVTVNEKQERRAPVKDAGSGGSRERRIGRQNAAMQAILQQRAAQNAVNMQGRSTEIAKDPVGDLTAGLRQQPRQNNYAEVAHPPHHSRPAPENPCLASPVLQEMQTTSQHGEHTDSSWIQAYGIHQSGMPPIGPMVRNNSVPPSYLQTVLPHMVAAPTMDYAFHQTQQPPQQPQQQPQQQQQPPPQQQGGKPVTSTPHTYLTSPPGVMWNYLSFVPPYQQACPTTPTGPSHQMVMQSAAASHLSQVQQTQQQQQQQHQTGYFMINSSGQPKVAQLEAMTPSLLHNFRGSGPGASPILNHNATEPGSTPSLLFRESVPPDQGMGQTMQARGWQQDTTRGTIGDITAAHLALGQGTTATQLSASQIVGRAVRQPVPTLQANSPASQTTANPAVTTAIADLGTSTYSLFSSPWPSGLTMVRTNKEGSRPTNAIGSVDPLVMQPRIQSLWSGPGPSPLERLLEQQKQRRDSAGQ